MTSARSDRCSPAISHRKDIGTSSVATLTNLAFLEILWCETLRSEMAFSKMWFFHQFCILNGILASSSKILEDVYHFSWKY
jgi:hypothetical protein